MPILDNFNPWLLLAVGVVLVCLGALRFQLHRRRMVAIQLVPLDQAKGFVEVRGTVSVGKAGIEQAPFSERASVWVRITLDAESGPEGARWRNMHQEVRAKDFVLRNASGASLHVEPKKAEVRSGVKTVVLVGPGEEPPPKMVEYLASQGGTIQDLRDFMVKPGSVRVIEEIVPLGDEVYVAGKAVGAGSAVEIAGSPLYVTHEEIGALARSGKLWDGRARE